MENYREGGIQHGGNPLSTAFAMPVVMKRFSSFMPVFGALLVGGGAACGAAGGSSDSEQMYGGGSTSNAATSSGTSEANATNDAGTASATTGSGNGATTTAPSSGSDAGAATGTSAPPAPAVIVTDPFAALKQGSAQLAAFCARGGADVISTSLCASPSIGDLSDLQKAIGLSFKNPTGGNGAGGNPAFVLLGHSASLAVRSISSANPRAVLMSVPEGWQPSSNIAMNSDGEGPPPGWNPPATGWSQPSDWQTPTWCQDWGCTNSWPPAGWDSTPAPSNSPIKDGVAMGYSRGQDIVELAANDPSTNVLKFVAVKYTRAIEDGTASGTSGTETGDFSSDSEGGWSSWTPYDDGDLANTTVDCTHCHQPGGTGTAKILRMNELETPWTHSMSNWTTGGQALLADFHSVHGTTEDYGGIPAAMIDKSEPDTLQLVAEADPSMKQPVTFDSGSIESEVAQSNAAQPQDNSIPGASATWNKLFADGLTAHVVVPYHDVKVTDSTKLTAAATAYKSGGADLGDLMTDDAKTATLITPSSTFDAPTLLGASCADCHNSHVPATIGRGHFDATNLGSMTRAEKDIAIARLQLTTPDVLHMPPVSVHDLSATQIQTLVTYLQQ